MAEVAAKDKANLLKKRQAVAAEKATKRTAKPKRELGVCCIVKYGNALPAYFRRCPDCTLDIAEQV